MIFAIVFIISSYLSLTFIVGRKIAKRQVKKLRKLAKFYGDKISALSCYKTRIDKYFARENKGDPSYLLVGTKYNSVDEAYQTTIAEKIKFENLGDAVNKKLSFWERIADPYLEFPIILIILLIISSSVTLANFLDYFCTKAEYFNDKIIEYDLENGIYYTIHERNKYVLTTHDKGNFWWFYYPTTEDDMIDTKLYNNLDN